MLLVLTAIVYYCFIEIEIYKIISKIFCLQSNLEHRKSYFIYHQIDLKCYKWLYSDRTEHFCGRGPRNLTKLLEGVQYMEKLISSPSEPFLAIRVCQKCQKIKNHEKPGFWGNFGYISATVKSIFMIFWDKTPKTNS